MRLDDEGLCWLCDKPLDSERSAATSWRGFGVHKACARDEETREEPGGLDNRNVIGTST
jgi:hypothetical protein